MKKLHWWCLDGLTEGHHGMSGEIMAVNMPDLIDDGGLTCLLITENSVSHEAEQ